jgi:hypothetical protein
MLYYSYSSVRGSLSCVSSPLYRSSVLSISTRREHCMGQMTHLLTFYMKCIDLWPPNLQKREGAFRLWRGLVCCQRLCCSLFRAQSHFSSQKVLALRGIYQQPLMYKSGNCAQCSTEFTPIIEFGVQASIQNPWSASK